jgi:hypothetical protein
VLLLDGGMVDSSVKEELKEQALLLMMMTVLNTLRNCVA